MTSTKIIWLLVGGSAVSIAVIFFAVPSLEAKLVDIVRVPDTPDYLLFGSIALIAVALSVILAVDRIVEGVTEIDLPIVETSNDHPPGFRNDVSLASLPLLRVTAENYSFFQYVRQVAIVVVSQHFDCSRDEAKQHLREGTWTDDPKPAQFLANSTLHPPPIHDRVRSITRGEQWFRHRVLRTIEALERLDGLES